MSSPPGGFYFCQPLLLVSSTPLIRSNVVPLQPPNFYQDRGIRSCLANEFQNTTTPFCAQEGVALGPDQMINPAPTVVGTVQVINASLDRKPTQSELLVIKKTPMPSNSLSGPGGIETSSVSTEHNSGNGRESESGDQSLAGIITGVVLVIVTVIVSTVLLSIIVALVRQRAHQGTTCNKIPITPTNRYLESPERFDSKFLNLIDHLKHNNINYCVRLK